MTKTGSQHQPLGLRGAPIETLRTYTVGCESAFVLFDSIYTQPDVRKHFLIGVSWTWEHGRWLVVHNQDSELKS